MAQDKLQFLEQLAKQLITGSDQFEPFVPTQGAPFESLKMLGGLEQVARESFKERVAQVQAEEVAKTTAEESALIAAQVRAHQKKTKAQVQYGSQREEYRPALSSPELIEALLKLKGQRQEPKLARKTAPATQAPAQTLGEPMFEAIDHPEIVAVPKLDPLSSVRGRRTNSKILRPDPQSE